MTMTNPGTDLTTPISAALSAPSVEAAREAMELYQEISNALLTPADVQEIRTRKGTSTFPKRSALQKLANAYRVSTEIVKRELTYDADGNLIRCDVIVRATHPDGRYSEGDGACSVTEERFKRGAEKIDHDLPATAVTRAKNRAISDLVAFGAVSAEEAEAGDTGPAGDAPGALPGWARPVNDISGVAESLVRLLKAAGVEHGNAAPLAMMIGEKTFDRCDSTVPLAVWQAINDIADELQTNRPTADDQVADGMTRGFDEAAAEDAEATSGPETGETTNDKENNA